MPGRIPDPCVTAGSLPSLGPLAGISATTLNDELKFGDLQDLGSMLSPLHFLDSLGKRALVIKTEVQAAPSSLEFSLPGFTQRYESESVLLIIRV